jgi:hypothetical protein
MFMWYASTCSLIRGSSSSSRKASARPRRCLKEHVRLVPAHYLQAQGDAEGVGPVRDTAKHVQAARAPAGVAGWGNFLSIPYNSASPASTLSGSAVLISACSGRPSEAVTSSEPFASTRRAATTPKASGVQQWDLEPVEARPARPYSTSGEPGVVEGSRPYQPAAANHSPVAVPRHPFHLSPSPRRRTIRHQSE